MTRLKILILSSLLALATGAAFAQTEQAQEQFAQGRAAYEQGDYDTALERWTAAYELDPQPLIQFNLAQAYERLGRLTEAVEALDLYLTNAPPDDVNQANARARRSALHERISNTGLRLVGGPSGATITIDGQEWGSLPRPDRIPVSAGTHQVVITAEGYETFRSSVVVAEGRAVDLEVSMIEAQGGTGTGAGSGVAGPMPRRSNSAVPWIVVASGGVLVIGGAIVGAVALGTASDAPGPESDEADTARALGLTADVLGIVGGLAISAGLVWFFVSRNRGGDNVALTPVLSPTDAGMSAQVSF